MKRTRTLTLWVAALVVAISVAASGCGDDESANDSEAAQAASGDGVEEAQKKVDALREPPEPLSIPELAQKPKQGRTAYWISCKFPECDSGDQGFEQAMETLDWELKTIKTDLTPEAYVASWAQAAAAKPDAIFSSGLVPNEILKEQLDQAEQVGAFVAIAGSAAQVGDDGIDASIASTPWIDENGAVLTDWAVADSDGDAKIAFLYDESVGTHVSALEAATKEAGRLCSECEVEGLPVRLAQAGKEVPGQVVSHLQRSQDVGYVLAPVSSLAVGVGQAIKSAGLEAQVGTAASSPANLAAIAEGTEAVAVTNELSTLAWRMSDAAVRGIEGEELPDKLANPLGTRQLFDESNIETADLETPWDVPDVPETFARAWKLG